MIFYSPPSAIVVANNVGKIVNKPSIEPMSLDGFLAPIKLLSSFNQYVIIW